MNTPTKFYVVHSKERGELLVMGVGKGEPEPDKDMYKAGPFTDADSALAWVDDFWATRGGQDLIVIVLVIALVAVAALGFWVGSPS